MDNKSQSVKKIFFAFKDKCPTCILRDEEDCNANCLECVNGQKSALHRLILEKLPKEREHKCPKKDICLVCEENGTISEIKSILSELFEERGSKEEK